MDDLSIPYPPDDTPLIEVKNFLGLWHPCCVIKHTSASTKGARHHVLYENGEVEQLLELKKSDKGIRWREFIETESQPCSRTPLTLDVMEKKYVEAFVKQREAGSKLVCIGPDNPLRPAGKKKKELLKIGEQEVKPLALMQACCKEGGPKKCRQEWLWDKISARLGLCSGEESADQQVACSLMRIFGHYFGGTWSLMRKNRPPRQYSKVKSEGAEKKKKLMDKTDKKNTKKRKKGQADDPSKLSKSQKLAIKGGQKGSVPKKSPKQAANSKSKSGGTQGKKRRKKDESKKGSKVTKDDAVVHPKVITPEELFSLYNKSYEYGKNTWPEKY
jgi:hypothetical protein